MRQVPRWAKLKHFYNVTTVDYTDGQTFLDILKVRFSLYDLDLVLLLKFLA